MLQVLLGPIVEIELVHPFEVVPQGVTFHIKHFLSSSQHYCPVENKLLAKGDSHDIVKVTKTGDHFVIESIDTHSQIESEYFSTSNLQGQSLCHLTTAWLWGPDKAQCNDSSLKQIAVTLEKGFCPHQQGSLAVWCYCKAAEQRFEKMLEDQGHERTRVVIEQHIEKDAAANYFVSVSPNKEARPSTDPKSEEIREISHLVMCKYGGVRKLGPAVQESFSCGCDERIECRTHPQIWVKVLENSTNKVYSDSKVLSCDHTKEGKRKERQTMHNHLPQDSTRELKSSQRSMLTTDGATIGPVDSSDCGWGVKEGTRDDKEDLKEIITAEMSKPENHGSTFPFMKTMTMPMSISGLDEELANAIDKAFYDRYKTWKLDNPNASTRQQVTEVENMPCILYNCAKLC